MKVMAKYNVLVFVFVLKSVLNCSLYFCLLLLVWYKFIKKSLLSQT